ncbi:FtsX-like permease family protein [Spirosoma pollinicola]|uniref:ABC transporter permease n=1 Tax=Spirosoma pollinicola TaxID=2057025 RepID=A0A2K8Z0G9_9BACT|nr:FtsX-like permease family protein [Spirosoma pollinicola]AUD03386.1 ABC transporter permease [Spirosoma pollinicola]
MLTNYLKIAWRNLRKNSTYAFINVVGLGLGIGCALLIFALVRYHYQIDRHHHNYDRIYQFTSKFISPEGDFNTNGIPYPFGKALRTDHPEIEHVAMLEEWYEPMVLVPTVTGPGKKIKDTDHAGAFAEPAFFQIFDYTWLAGGPDDLTQPGTVVISADRARTYFGTINNVLGLTIRLDARTPARVVGVFADYKDNTDLAYSIIASWSTLKEQRGSSPEAEPFDNTNGSTHCFAIFNSHYTAANWNRQMLAFVKKNNPKNARKTDYPAQPFSAMHLSADFGGVSRGLLLSLFAIGLLLIGTASINFVNLATAQALSRAREVGVRKVLGSTQSQLFWQFMGETALIVLAATALAIGLFQYGQTLAQTYLHGVFRFTFYFSPSIIGWLLVLIVGVTLLAGLYPALVLAGFRPVVALAGRLTTRQAGGISIRRGLVVTQFAISQVLIIGLVVVASQLRYVREKDLGFRKDAILTISLPDLPSQDVTKLNTFRNLATALPDVDQISYSMGGPPQSTSTSHTTIRFDTHTEDEKFGPQQAFIDADYVGLYGLKLVAGRNLQRSDTAREALVNETFVRRLGLKPTDVLGKHLHRGGFVPLGLEVVGVLKDYNQSDLKSSIDPMFLTTLASGYYSASVQLRSTNYQRAIKQLETAYSRVYPDNFFATQFVDDRIERSYQQEQTMGNLINFFAGVALLIGCMGLYGLVLFMVAQKTKEIGVRKVLGASVSNILWLLSREFVRLILIAFTLAVPLAWWVMSRWLNNFKYKISLAPGIFLIALLATIAVAALTVSFQSIKAALMNPVKSLKTE